MKLTEENMRNKVLAILANPDEVDEEIKEAEAAKVAAAAAVTLERSLTEEEVVDEDDEEAVKERMVFAEIEKFRIRQAARDKEAEEQKKIRVQDRLRQLRENQVRMAAAVVEETAKAVANAAAEAAGLGVDKRSRETEEEDAESSKRRRQEVRDLVSGDALEEDFSMRTTKVGIKLTATTVKAAKINPSAKLFSAASAEEEVKPLRSFVPIDYSEDDVASKEAELKRKQKELVDQIPTEKAALFAYTIDWMEVQKLELTETSLRPWIVKKIVEYLGEEEKTLIDFIIAKVSNRCDPAELLRELLPVLDEDAEQFVIKLWRMLIFSLIAAANLRKV
jgi:RNA-binding protein 25